jgi:hypothetical protein
VSVPSAQSAVEAPPGDDEDQLASQRRRRRRLFSAAALALVAAAVVIIVVSDPFGGGGTSPGSGTDNEYPTSQTAILSEPLSSQTQVSAVLGYAGDITVRLPAGTAPTAVAAAQQSVATDEGMLSSALSSLSSDQTTLAQARATLSADSQQQAIDCAGDGAAQSGGPSAGGASAGGCASAAALVSSDNQAVGADAAKVSTDEVQATSAQSALSAGRTALVQAQSQETSYGQSSTFTALPSAGAVIHRGQRVYAIDGQPVLLLYGSDVAARAFMAGMSAGPDVGELNANLEALGYGRDLSGDSFTAATAAAIRALQSATGSSVTGELLLGSVVFEPRPLRVTSLAPTLGVGSSVMAGPVLSATSTARQVTIELDAAEQGEVKVGDPVTITLPDNQTTPGRISYVSSVASSSSQGGGPTIEVDAVPTDPSATGSLDQAPVNVSITTASVARALVVPVDALLALSSGGYAVEVVSGRAHHLVAVSTGLFDDADGLVQISGSGVAAGQRVVVPNL